ncbi:MAG: hypothetical protein LBP26_07545 [Clostridiales bacterium]|jgi:hypothetical protein|nr:hypothetical protein [Clostridiales bacterium]
MKITLTKLKRVICMAAVLATAFCAGACFIGFRRGKEPEQPPRGNPIDKALVTPPTKTAYGFGESVDVAGTVIKNFYADGTEDTYTVTAESKELHTVPAVISSNFWHSGLTVELYCVFGKIGEYTISIAPPEQVEGLLLYKTPDIAFFYPPELVFEEQADGDVAFASGGEGTFDMLLQKREQAYYAAVAADESWKTAFKNEYSEQRFLIVGFALISFVKQPHPDDNSTPMAEFLCYQVPVSKDGAAYTASRYIFKGAKTYVLTVLKGSSAYTDGDGANHYDMSDLLIDLHDNMFVRQW